MRKTIRNMLLAVLAIIALQASFPTAYAAGTPRDVSVYLYRDYTDCVFFVGWENASQSAAVQIKNPDGGIIDANSQNTVFGNGKATVNAGSAKSGYWTITVTGENLGTISVSGGSKNGTSAQDNAIQSFSADVAGGYINFKWDVAANTDTINVSINATQGDSYGNRSLWTDYSASKNGSASVSVDELQTGLYNFSIQAYDGNGQYTLTTEEPVYIQQSNAPEKLEDVRVGSIDGEMFAAWNVRLNAGYMVTLYDYETLSVIRTERVDTNFYTITLPDGMTRAKFSVCATDGNSYGSFDVFEIVRSTPTGEITFPNFSATRESTISIKVDCASELTAGVYLDGTPLLDNAGAGDYDLTLSEGTHEVIGYIKDKNGNMKTFTKIISVDKTPPVVNLNAADTVKTVSDNFILEGNTEPNAVVAINGVEQKLGSGSFMAKLALANGVNPVTVSAYDTAGNKGVKTITAERTGPFGSGWSIYILPGLIFILLAVWYIRLNKKAKAAHTDEKVS